MQRRRLRQKLKLKYGLAGKGVVLGVFCLYAIVISAYNFVSHQRTKVQHETYLTEPSLSLAAAGRILSNSSHGNQSVLATAKMPSDCFFKDMGEGTYPKHLVTCEQMKNGAIILPIIGCAFMFIGLAIICDDFFVPALETISWRLDLTDDVAGE